MNNVNIFTTFLSIFVLIMIFTGTIFISDILTKKKTLGDRLKQVVDQSLYRVMKTKKTVGLGIMFGTKAVLEFTRVILWFSLTMLPVAVVSLFFNFAIDTLIVLALIYVTGLLLMYGAITKFKQRQKQKFIDQLPEAIELMSRTISAGRSVTEAINIASENFTDLLGDAFSDIYDDVNLGIPLNDALSNVATRIKINEFFFFTIILETQAQTGGNIVKILLRLSDTLRKKHDTELKIKTITSEPALTGIVLGLIPVIILIANSLISPAYMAPLLHTRTGHIILAGCLAMEVLGMIVIRQLSRIDI